MAARIRKTLWLSAFFALSACGAQTSSDSGSSPLPPAPKATPSLDMVIKSQIDEAARRFVELALAFGPHDANYVDAYTGDPAIAARVEANPLSLEQIDMQAQNLMASLQDIMPAPAQAPRLKMLTGDLRALQTRLRMLGGERLLFDEETRLLYDAVSPQYTETDFKAALGVIDVVLPGSGSIGERAAALDAAMTVPRDKIEPVMRAAIDACRARTALHIDLPEDERFDLEFVTDKPWSAYNWYKGGFKSVIQVNLDQPFTLERALELGCHEGYPGHHVYSVLAEQQRTIAQGWPETSVIPLFSPSGPIMEGSGNYGVPLAFPDADKAGFEAQVLAPIAGINPDYVYTSAAYHTALSGISHVQTHVAREYLDGRMSRDDAVAFLVKYKVVTQKRAEQSVDFIETYRGYVINYALGQDVVADYVARKVDAGQTPWDAFIYILETPVSVSDLMAD